VVAEWGRAGRGDPASEDSAAIGGCRRSRLSAPTGDATPLGQYLSPRLDYYFGGLPQSAASTARPLRAGAVAAAYSSSHTERNSRDASGSLKTLPLKASPTSYIGYERC